PRLLPHLHTTSSPHHTTAWPRRPPPPSPTRRSSDLHILVEGHDAGPGLRARSHLPAPDQMCRDQLDGHDGDDHRRQIGDEIVEADRKSTRLNSSHLGISYAVFCLKKKKYARQRIRRT